MHHAESRGPPAQEFCTAKAAQLIRKALPKFPIGTVSHQCMMNSCLKLTPSQSGRRRSSVVLEALAVTDPAAFAKANGSATVGTRRAARRCQQCRRHGGLLPVSMQWCNQFKWMHALHRHTVV